ncbi:MAG TPA: trigger factor [Candidatus Anaerobiospirillum stercoravium]|nr:trigger factor [Candidatus Anaerobiospirillum stercoravium]
MQANITKTEGNKATIEVIVPVDVVKEEYQTSFRKYAQNARIDGFRKGHVPKTVLLSRYGASIQQAVIDQLLQDSIKEVFADGSKLGVTLAQDLDLQVVELSSFQPDAEFKFTCTCNIIPAFDIASAKSINFEQIKIEVNEDDINKTIDTLRRQRGEFVPQEGAEITAQDCEVILNFVGTRDGVAFEGGAANDFRLEMGRTQMIPGFCEQLVGHKAGDQFDIECTFPEDYNAEELRGAQAKFAITINQVSVLQLPEVDAEFIKAFGLEGKSYDEFVQDLKQQLLAQSENDVFKYNIRALLLALADHFGIDNFKPRERDVEEAARELTKRTFRFTDDKKNDPKFKAFFDMVMTMSMPPVLPEQIEHSVIYTLTATKSIDVADPTEDEISALIEKRSILFENPEEYKQEVREDKEEMRVLRITCSNQKFYEALCALVTTSEKVLSYTEAVNLFNKAAEELNNRMTALCEQWYPRTAAQKA